MIYGLLQHNQQLEKKVGDLEVEMSFLQEIVKELLDMSFYDLDSDDLKRISELREKYGVRQ